MPLSVRERGADSPLVSVIRHVVYDGASGGVTTPDGCWDLVVMRRRGQVSVLQTGVITRPVDMGYQSGDEYLCISFKPGVYMPPIAGGGGAERMVDQAFLRPIVNPRAFHLDGDKLEIPTFENADGLISRLARAGLLRRDEVVARVVDGVPWAISPRSLQRHFQQSMGITAKQYAQIVRAGRAVSLLTGGRAAVDVANELGFSDQAHLTRSLKTFMGRTPGAILRAARGDGIVAVGDMAFGGFLQESKRGGVVE
jgi:AraC-like DNA-binding protein